MNGACPSYIYRMDKYDGCNVVESVISAGKKPEKRVKPRSRRGLAVRYGIAAAVVGLLCFFAFAPIPAFTSVRKVIRDVFCYDVFGRSEFGGSPLFTRLFGA